MADGYAPPRRLDVALLATAVEAQDAHVARQRERLFASAERGRPEVGHETWHQVDVRAAGESYRLRVAQSRGARYHVELDGKAVDVDGASAPGRFERKLTVGGQTFAVLSVPQGPDYLVEVDGAVHRISGGEAGLVRAPAPAMVVAIPVAVGRRGDGGRRRRRRGEHEAGDGAARRRSPAGCGRSWSRRTPRSRAARSWCAWSRTPTTPWRRGAGSGSTCAALAGAAGRGLATPATRGRRRAHLAALPGARLRHRRARRPPAAGRARRGPRGAAARRPGVLAGETRRAADLRRPLRAVAQPARAREDETQQIDPAGEEARNPQEYLYAYLRSRDADAEGLPESFRAKLRRALAHYGVPDLETSDAADALHSALYRMFLAHRRAAAHVPVLLELLQWRLRHPDSLPGGVRERYQRVLDQLVSATQLRHPVVGGLARRVRYTCFDAPLIAAERARGQQAGARRAGPAAPTTRPSGRRRSTRIVAAGRADPRRCSGARHHAVMLEVMTRRYYRIAHPAPTCSVDRPAAGAPLLTAAYSRRAVTPRIGARHHRAHRAGRAARGADPIGRAGRPAPADRASCRTARAVLLDLYVIAGEAPDADPERSAEKIRAMLGRLPDRLERVAVAVRRPQGDERSAWFTFRPGPRGPAAGRGPHPARPAPDGGRAARALAAARLRAHPAAVAGRRAPVPRRRPQRARRQAAHRALRRPRPHGAARRARGRDPRAAPAGARARRLPGRAARGPRGRPAATRAWTGTGCCSTCGRWCDVPLDELDDGRAHPGAPHRGAGAGAGARASSAHAGVAGASEPQELLLRMSRPPGAGLTVRVTEPPTAPLRELDAYTQKVIRARRRGAVYPYELVPMLVAQPGPGRRRPARSPSTTSTTTGAPVPVDRAAGAEHGQHRAGHGHHADRALPGGHDAASC